MKNELQIQKRHFSHNPTLANQSLSRTCLRALGPSCTQKKIAVYDKLAYTNYLMCSQAKGLDVDWTRTILDGLAMAAYFNLFAAAVALYKPRLMFPCYPPAIIKAAKEPPTKAENRSYWLWICFGELLPLLLYGAVSAVEDGTTGFRHLTLTGYVQWMIVNFCDLVFLDFWLIQKKAKQRFIIPGTEGHPGYGFKAWMKGYALPEHLLQWPFLMCPLMAAAQAGLGLLLQKI